MSGPLVVKRMPGRRGESEQNSSRGPAMHLPPSSMQSARRGPYRLLRSIWSASSRHWLASSMYMRTTPASRVARDFDSHSSAFARICSGVTATLAAHVHGERPRGRRVPCHVSTIAQYCALLTEGETLSHQLSKFAQTTACKRRRLWSWNCWASWPTAKPFRLAGRSASAMGHIGRTVCVQQNTGTLAKA